MSRYGAVLLGTWIRKRVSPPAQTSPFMFVFIASVSLRIVHGSHHVIHTSSFRTVLADSRPAMQRARASEDLPGATCDTSEPGRPEAIEEDSDSSSDSSSDSDSTHAPASPTSSEPSSAHRSRCMQHEPKHPQTLVSPTQSASSDLSPRRGGRREFVTGARAASSAHVEIETTAINLARPPWNPLGSHP